MRTQPRGFPPRANANPTNANPERPATPPAPPPPLSLSRQLLRRTTLGIRKGAGGARGRRRRNGKRRRAAAAAENPRRRRRHGTGGERERGAKRAEIDPGGNGVLGNRADRSRRSEYALQGGGRRIAKGEGSGERAPSREARVISLPVNGGDGYNMNPAGSDSV
ncbi:hypothetical protein NL676_038122 [Syzygium grande]|nr:hypothetical protein NL676_038122 [Syzygium grande]